MDKPLRAALESCEAAMNAALAAEDSGEGENTNMVANAPGAALARAVQTIENISRAGSESAQLGRAAAARIHSLSVKLYNGSRSITHGRVAGPLKHAAGLGLMCANHDAAQCALVFASAARKYEDGATNASGRDDENNNNNQLKKLARTCFSHVLTHLEGTAETETKQRLVITAILGVARSYVFAGAPSSDIASALEYLQGALRIPSLITQDHFQVLEILHSTATMLALENRHRETLQWAAQIRQSHPMMARGAAGDPIQAKISYVISNAMLLRVEALLELSCATDAETTIREHAKFFNVKGVETRAGEEASDTAGGGFLVALTITDKDRWNRCRFKVSLQQRNQQAALAQLIHAIQFAKRTSSMFGCPDQTSIKDQSSASASALGLKTGAAKALDGERLDQLLGICVQYASACSWSFESLKPFVLLADAASLSAAENYQRVGRTCNETSKASSTEVGTAEDSSKAAASGSETHADKEKGRAYMIVLRRLMVELISAAQSCATKDAHLGANGSIDATTASISGTDTTTCELPTSQLLQAASMVKTVPFLEQSASAHKTVTSIMADYSHFLLVNAHFSDCETVVRVLLANMQEASTRFIGHREHVQNDGLAFSREDRAWTAARLVLAGVLLKLGRFQEALAENTLVAEKYSDEFSVQHQRLEIFLQAAQNLRAYDELVQTTHDDKSDGADDDSGEQATALAAAAAAPTTASSSSSSSSSSSATTTTTTDSSMRTVSTSLAMISAINKAVDRCISAKDSTYRGMLAIAHTLQKTGAGVATTNDTNMASATKLALCKVLQFIVTNIARGTFPDELQGQIFSTLLSEQMHVYSTGQERAVEVLSTLKNLLAAVRRQITPPSLSTEVAGGEGGQLSRHSVDDQCALPPSPLPFDLSSFGHVNNLRFCLRIAVAVLQEQNCAARLKDTYSRASGTKTEMKSDTTSSEKPSSLSTTSSSALTSLSSGVPMLDTTSLISELYTVLDRIQQLVGYEEVPRAKLLALQASNLLQCSVYNHDDVMRIITTARSELQCEAETGGRAATTLAASGGAAGFATPTAVSDGSDPRAMIEMLLGVVEFKLCVQTHMPDSETEALALIARFQRRHTFTRTPGFFETIGNVVVEVCGKRGRRIQIKALSAELENRLRGAQKKNTTPAATASSAVAEGIANCAKCFRQLVEIEPDNVDRIRWLGKALEFARACGGTCDSAKVHESHSGDDVRGNATPPSYPLEELSWLAATSWNCGLACQKAGATRRESQHFLTLAIKVAQLRPDVVRSDELESMLQWYAEEHEC